MSRGELWITSPISGTDFEEPSLLNSFDFVSVAALSLSPLGKWKDVGLTLFLLLMRSTPRCCRDSTDKKMHDSFCFQIYPLVIRVEHSHIS